MQHQGKKNPQPSCRRLGILPASTPQSHPRRPCCEEYPGRFSDSPDLNLPSHPAPSTRSGLWTVAFLVKAFPLKKKRIGTTAAGPSPTFPLKRDHGVPFTRISPIQIPLFLTEREKGCQVLSLNPIDQVLSFSLEESTEVLLKDGENLIRRYITQPSHMGCNNHILKPPQRMIFRQWLRTKSI
jgi:hypothetical protein